MNFLNSNKLKKNNQKQLNLMKKFKNNHNKVIDICIISIAVILRNILKIRRN